MQLDLKSVDEDDLTLTGTAQVLREIEALIKVCPPISAPERS